MLKPKIFTLAILCLIASNIIAQNEADAVRYSQQTIVSTARSMGVAGAFGAVGGDPSSAAINPSGLARFRKSRLFLSTGFYNAKANTTYIDQTYSDKKFNFNLPNLSLIANIPGEDFESKNPKGFVNFVFGVNVNRLNNFHKRTIFDANNQSNSLTQNLAERGNGKINDNFSQYSLEYLGYYSYLFDIDTAFKTDPTYKSAYFGQPINVNQTGTLNTRGALNDYSISFAGNYAHIIQGGIALGFKSVRYIENYSFTETDRKSNSIKDIKSVDLDQYLKTTGVGLNAKVGFSVQPNDYIRFGYAFHSPTQFNLTDSYKYTIDSKFDVGATYYDPYTNSTRNRENTNLSTEATVYKYKITTPSRNVFSLALMNKEIGFLSLDVETVNYGSARLAPAKNDIYAFKDENKSLARNYNNVVNIRLGGEILYEQFRFRGGYARYPSPFKNGYVPYVKDLVNNIYTLGFGIKTDKYSFDMAYINSGYADYTVPYTLSNKATYSATNNIRSTNFVITVGLNID